MDEAGVLNMLRTLSPAMVNRDLNERYDGVRDEGKLDALKKPEDFRIQVRQKLDKGVSEECN